MTFSWSKYVSDFWKSKLVHHWYQVHKMNTITHGEVLHLEYMYDLKIWDSKTLQQIQNLHLIHRIPYSPMLVFSTEDYRAICCISWGKRRRADVWFASRIKWILGGRGCSMTTVSKCQFDKKIIRIWILFTRIFPK